MNYTGFNYISRLKDIRKHINLTHKEDYFHLLVGGEVK